MSCGPQAQLHQHLGGGSEFLAQLVQIFRHRRWARIPSLHRRGDQERLDAHVAEPALIVLGAVVGVQRAKHHVAGERDACTAIWAVSRSRISPTRMISGSSAEG